MRTQSVRRGIQLAAVATAVIASSLCSASQAAALTACEAFKPVIEQVGLTEMTPAGVVLEAQINPQNSATTYEFVIVGQVRNPSEIGERTPEGPRALGGPIPAYAGDVKVSGLVTGLQRGYTYWYEVVASNLAGETRSDGDNWFSYHFTGGYPDGVGGAPYTATAPSGCSLEVAQQEAERLAARTEAERLQHARAHEEQVAKEAAVRYAAAALKQREQEAADAASDIPSCIVPTLRGDTLSAARRAISKAHCRLGEVHEPPHHRGMLLIVGQSKRHGEQLAGGTVIAVTMGTSRSGHRRTG